MLGAFLTLIDSEPNKKLFEAYYTGYKDMMYNIAYGVIHDTQLAEDAVMNSFMILARSMDKMSDRNMSEVRNFLVVIVRNQAIDIYRKQKRNVYGADELIDLPDNSDTVYDVENKELQQTVFAIIKELDQSSADVLMMKYFYGFKTSEIAKSLGMTAEGVHTKHRRALAMIRRKLAEEGVT